MEIEIKPLSPDDPDRVYKRVGEMFVDLYDIMVKKGLTYYLAENGEKIWLNSIKPSLGKLNIVFLAYDGDKIVGFISGNIKLSPAFLGSEKIGYVSLLYTDSKYRKSKIGQLLFSELENWFWEKEVRRIELEALSGNEAGLNICLKLGYKVDIIRMYKNNDKI